MCWSRSCRQCVSHHLTKLVQSHKTGNYSYPTCVESDMTVQKLRSRLHLYPKPWNIWFRRKFTKVAEQRKGAGSRLLEGASIPVRVSPQRGLVHLKLTQDLPVNKLCTRGYKIFVSAHLVSTNARVRWLPQKKECSIGYRLVWST